MLPPIFKNRACLILHPLAAAALTALSGAVHAQSPGPAAVPASAASATPATAASAAATGAPDSVQTVVVTANRRRELARDVAGGVNVLGNAQLDQVNATSLQDVAGYVPGLQVTGDNPGMKRETIRGITTGSLQVGASVAAYLDEAPISLSTSVVGGAILSPDIDPLDVERIEILKGPQGSLYGASALGGLIKYVTITPNLKAIEGRAEVGYSTVSGGGDGVSVRGSINVPIVTDLLAVRLTAYSRTDPGYVDDTLRNLKDVNLWRNQGARMTAYLKPNDRFDAKLVVDTQVIKSDDSATPQYDAATLQPRFGDYGAQNVFAQPLKNAYDRDALTLNYDLGFANLLSVTSFMRQKTNTTSDGSHYLAFLDAATAGAYAAAGLPVTPLGVTAAKAISALTMEKKVQEFRLTSPSGRRLEWLGGVFFQEETGHDTTDYDAYTGTNLTTPTVPGYVYGLVNDRLRETAAYANATWHFTDRFDVQAGVRYARLSQEYDTTVQSYNYLTAGPVATPRTEGNTSQNKSTWMLAPRWKPDDDNMFYLRAASGYRPGGPNSPPIFGPQKPPFTSDSIVNYEVGYKGILPSAGIDLTAALFRIQWKDIQVTAVDPTYGFSYNTNGGKAHSQGVELEAGWRAAPGLRIGANLTAMQARLDQDVPAVGGLSGDDIPYTPKFSAGLLADYAWTVGQGQASVGASLIHNGERNTVFSHQSATPLVPSITAPTLPSYDLLDLRGSYRWDDWTLSLFVKNALDKRGLLSYSGNGVATDLGTGVVSPAGVAVTTPRTVTVSVRVDF